MHATLERRVVKSWLASNAWKAELLVHFEETLVPYLLKVLCYELTTTVNK